MFIKARSIVKSSVIPQFTPDNKYGYACAQRYADKRKFRYQKKRKLTPAVRTRIVFYLQKGWSPQQIIGRLRILGRPTVSHETIYEMIRRDKMHGGKLYSYCRFKLKHRNHRLRRDGTRLNDKKKRIGERPAEADGKRFGDWEMDLIVGKNNSAALTMVERSTGKLMIRKLPDGKCAQGVNEEVIKALKPFKKSVLTITTDNGSEFAGFQEMEKALDTQIYFANPSSPWQKGLIENTNMLIRQYIPKAMNIKTLTHEEITMVQDKINKRPRRKLKFRTPEFVFKNRMI